MCLNQSPKVTTKVLKWLITKGWNPNYCIALFFYSASHNQWHLLWRHLQTVSYSHSPPTSTSHLQKTRHHTTSLMCYIQWSIKAKSATTWTAVHTTLIISIHSYMFNVRLLEMSPQPTHSMRYHRHFVMASQTSSSRCCNKSQHLHLHPHVLGPYALSSCTLFCHDSPL